MIRRNDTCGSLQGDSISRRHEGAPVAAREGMMRTRLLVALLALLAGISQLATAQDSQNKNLPEKKDAQSKDAARIEKPDVHEFVMANFRTESGVTLPQAKVVYGTYGHLNAARDNEVLLPSHYMANHTG